MILSDEHDYSHLTDLNSGFSYDSISTQSSNDPFAGQNNIVLQPAQ